MDDLAYWCHKCSKQIQPIYEPSLRCPDCNGAFVETIEDTNLRPQTTTHSQPLPNFPQTQIDPLSQFFSVIHHVNSVSTNSVPSFFDLAFGYPGTNPNDYAWGANLDRLLNNLFVNSNSCRVNTPTASYVIDSLPKAFVEQTQVDQKQICPICRDEFNLNDIFITLPCSHIFHSDCITTWLKTNNRCPVCRFELESEQVQVQRPVCNLRWGCPSQRNT